MKGRLNNQMRDDMRKALLAHAYGARAAELDSEAIELRNEAIERLLTRAQIKAIETLVPIIHKEGGHNNGAITWGGDIAVNCGGPKINLAISDYGRAYEPIDGSYPMLRSIRECRLDLAADDDLAVRVQDWADRCESLHTEKKVSTEQIRAALAAFSTVSSMQASWPEVMPVVQDIIVEHLGRPAPSLPAVVITEMNAKLGLPPSNDDTLELTEVAA